MDKRPVIICIGSDKVCGDMIGPLAGTYLVHDYNVNAYVYGTLNMPVNGVNMKHYINMIKNIHNNNIIISIDSAVGSSNDIGKVKIKEGGVNAGAALGNSRTIGDIGVVGVVASVKGDIMSNLLLAEYSAVDRISRKIAHIIYKSINLS